MQDVQAKLVQVQRFLPKEMDPPVITKTNPEDQPIIWGPSADTVQANYFAALEMYLFCATNNHRRTREVVNNAWDETIMENADVSLQDSIPDRLTLLRALRAKIAPYIKLEGEE